MTLYGHGIYYRTYAEDGDMSSLHGPTISICNLSADPPLLHQRHWTSGQPYRLASIQCSAAKVQVGGDITSLLGHHDRIAGIDLFDFDPTKGQLERCAALMQEPFQSPRSLRLHSCPRARAVPVVIDTFLGGSAPRLQVIELRGITFPALPKLLLSALVILSLGYITRAEYISPT